MMAYTAFHELRQQPQPVQATRQTKPRPEKFRNILAYLTYAADNGLPCPTNPEIGVEVGYFDEKSITSRIKSLATRGEIIIKNINGNVRTITIVATGKTTAPTKRR